MTVRTPLYALGLLGLTTLLTVGLASPAGAAETCEGPPGPQPTFNCFTMSTETVTVEQPVAGTVTNGDTFSTRVIVAGPDGIAIDQSIDAASDSPEVGALIDSANASVTGDGLTVTGTDTTTPQRTLADTTETQTTTFDREEVTVETVTTFGPDTVQTGPDRSETLAIPSGATNYNTITTNTYLTTATITITAVAPVGPTATTTSTTAPPAAAAPASTDTSSGELARTGSSNGPWTALGITLVLAGAGFLHLSRRSARRGQPLTR